MVKFKVGSVVDEFTMTKVKLLSCLWLARLEQQAMRGVLTSLYFDYDNSILCLLQSDVSSSQISSTSIDSLNRFTTRTLNKLYTQVHP